MSLTVEYEKSTPALLEKLNMGEVVPKLEIEQTLEDLRNGTFIKTG